MAAFNMEKELNKVDVSNTEISPLVRARLDETYASLTVQKQHTTRRRSSTLRRAVLTAAAAGILGVGVFASGFISPVMAASIKSIPIIGSLFSIIETDSGLRAGGELGLATNVNDAVSYEDVKLEVTETLYDGTRAAFIVNVTAPNLDNGTYDNGSKTMKLSNAIENVTLSINGKTEGEAASVLEGGLFYGGAGEAHPNTLVFEQVLSPTDTNSLPDRFTSKVSIKLDGIDHEFNVDVPFEKNNVETIALNPNTAVTKEDLTFGVANVSVSPITTRLTTSIALNSASSLTQREEERLREIGIAVYDDQGRQLTALSGDGVYEGNRLIFDRRYATTTGESKYLIIKPFIIKDDFAEDVQEDQFIAGLETKIDLSGN
ncbi:hypothetical protein BK126_22080 [Paenibacillus sp. FSL H7-0326]|uniref:DUF4179 domain-containing protein n=1 Tax=Paenibacillus sp. FSL H7-0326 TaxID=1921144 RepID=UPI00096C75F2|nr:DUF4179 domain-containing protein [Paenibacillus sp. FSL H7-0326]OMC65396.1 hypothetical protein BK126_22080 [Paenibacillus sp. FSL H7-0326]